MLTSWTNPLRANGLWPAQSARARFPDCETLELITARGACLAAAVERVAKLRQLRGEALRAHQTQALRALLEASQSVHFYRDLYAKAGFEPASVSTLEDLASVPLVDKAAWRAASLASLRSSAVRCDAWLLSSSGSTGVPSRLFRDAPAMWRFMARNLELYRTWCAELGGPCQSGLFILDFAAGSIDYLIADLLRITTPEPRIIPSHRPVAEHVAALRKFRPDYVSSYPSTMRNLAIALHRRGEVCRSLRLLHLTSETLDRGTRGLLASVFPAARIVETYVSTEAGLVAFACPAGRMHIAEDGVLVEIVDDHGRPTSGQGHVVVTDLTNHVTPVIRYRGLGDLACWSTGPCPCDSPYLAIQRLEGRAADSILTPDGAWLSPYEVIDCVEDLPGIYQFQIEQLAVGEVLVRVVPDLNAAAAGQQRLVDSIRRAMAARMPGVDCQVEFVSQIAPPTGRHKVPLVVSRVAMRGTQ